MLVSIYILIAVACVTKPHLPICMSSTHMLTGEVPHGMSTSYLVIPQVWHAHVCCHHVCCDQRMHTDASIQRCCCCPAARLSHGAAGPVPADLARQPNLAFLDLSHNQLSGSLHAFGAALTGSNNLLQVGGSIGLAHVLYRGATCSSKAFKHDNRCSHSGKEVCCCCSVVLLVLVLRRQGMLLSLHSQCCRLGRL